MTADRDLSSQKARFYFSLEVSLIAWVLLTLSTGGALALPSLALAISSLGGMLFILWLGMRDPVYIRLRQTESTPA
jgi:hypothetical protein